MDGVLLLDSTGASVAFAVLRLLGAAGGIAIGRSYAGSWSSPVPMPLSLLLMSAAVQFVIFAILQVPLLSAPNFAVVAVLVFVGGAYGFRSKRSEQMCRQYPWLFRAAGAGGWSDRDG